MSFKINSTYSQYTKVLTSEDADGVILYQGFAAPGTLSSASAWLIRKFQRNTGGTPQWSWANNETIADKVWDNRTTYTYTF